MKLSSHSTVFPSAMMAGGCVLVPRICNFVFGHKTRRLSALTEAVQAVDSFSYTVHEKDYSTIKFII